MTSIAILYHSGFGITHQLALAIKNGIKLVKEAEVNLHNSKYLQMPPVKYDQKMLGAIR